MSEEENISKQQHRRYQYTNEGLRLYTGDGMRYVIQLVPEKNRRRATKLQPENGVYDLRKLRCEQKKYLTSFVCVEKFIVTFLCGLLTYLGFVFYYRWVRFVVGLN